jgi:glycosyltransferase involved in cell wall biosynthesis
VSDPAHLAIQLGNAESIFPHLLAEAWRQRGLQTCIVSATAPRRLPPEAGSTPIVDVSVERWPLGQVMKRAGRRVLSPLDMAGSRLARRRFSEQTGFASPQRWETMFLPHVLNGWRVARAAQRLNPLFVFGHEVTSYGLATAWVSGAPRILFPWGADVMTTAEVSPWHFRMARFALQAADLIVPSSHTAARHIRARFGIAPEKVRPVSWGAELGQFRPASPDERARTRRQWRIDPSAHIVLNARRFLPLYNCESVVRAFIRIARARTDCHFVLLGGRDTDAYVDAAIREVASAVPAAADRFTFVRDNIPLADCASLMNCADAFVSVCDRVDMRSKSVVEAAAAGGVPIIGEAEVYRYM